jgi:hypothetical protein
LPKITRQTRTIEIETSTAQHISPDWNVPNRTTIAASGAVQRQREAVPFETAFFASFSNSCQHLTLRKSTRSLKPARLGNPRRASQIERSNNKSALFSLSSSESQHTTIHFAFKAPPTDSLFEGLF